MTYTPVARNSGRSGSVFEIEKFLPGELGNAGVGMPEEKQEPEPGEFGVSTPMRVVDGMRKPRCPFRRAPGTPEAVKFWKGLRKRRAVPIR
jgi:hypothetical protein